jgi:hypothetical protein
MVEEMPLPEGACVGERGEIRPPEDCRASPDLILLHRLPPRFVPWGGHRVLAERAGSRAVEQCQSRAAAWGSPLPLSYPLNET